MIKVIFKADDDKVGAAFAKSDEIVKMLANQNLTPEQVRFQTLDGALNYFFSGDGVIVLWNGSQLGEHSFHYTLYRQVEGKPGMGQYEAERMGAPELVGHTATIGGGLVLYAPDSWLENPRSDRSNWHGWFFHE